MKATRHGSGVVSTRLASAWAKSSRDDDRSMSLVQHCEDSAAVAGHLWDEWLPRCTRKSLSDGRPANEAKAMATWLAGIHDVGKLSPAFASQVPTLADAMRDAGLPSKTTIALARTTPHSLVSHRAVARYLTSRGASPQIAKGYGAVAGGHHGVFPTHSQLRFEEDTLHYGAAPWSETRFELLDHMARLTGADRHLGSWVRRPLSPQHQALWTAFVILADWIASSSDLFPLGVARSAVDTAADAWHELALPPPWRPTPSDDLDVLMSRRFDLAAGAEPNGVQRTVHEAVRAMTSSGLVVIEAPMGTGKTEAALAAAEHLAARFGQGGVFVALPSMATSTAMFSRVRRWIERQDAMPQASVVLAHGKASLVDEYRGLPGGGLTDDIGRDVESDVETRVVAHNWLSGRKKGLLADFAVGTIDQILFAGLKSRHLVLRHLAMVNKVVIVDEVHAADVFMRRYLIRVLEWLGAYDVPVVLMSATLPSEQRQDLVRAYEVGKGWGALGDDLGDEIGYPAVVSVDGRRRVHRVPDTAESTEVHLERLSDDMDELVACVRRTIGRGGCIGIVRDTVGRAQETARELAQHFPGEVTLLHSRYLARHRADLEAALVAELGPTGDRPMRRIVVGTQVIEQSLDVDFDVMVSDVAPIDLLFQRIGRLHRHRLPRPSGLEVPTLYLTGVDDWSQAPPRTAAGPRNVYGDYPLWCALAVLDGRTRLRLPTDIAALVERAYAHEVDFPDGWAEHVSAAAQVHRRDLEDAARRADTWRIAEPDASSTLIGWSDAHVGDVDGPRDRAKVRDTDESLEVIVTLRRGEGVELPVQCGGRLIDTAFRPEDARARAALGASVRLPRALTHPGIIDATIVELEQRMHRTYAGWRDSPWLSGELALELDAEGRAEILGHHIAYDDIEGLIVTMSTAS